LNSGDQRPAWIRPAGAHCRAGARRRAAGPQVTPCAHRPQPL